MGSCNRAYPCSLTMGVQNGHQQRRVEMRFLILAAAVGAAALPATAASAQYWGGNNGYNYQQQRECNRALRHADTRWEYDRIMRRCQRITAHSYDYGRYRDNGYGDRYNNDGRYWD